MYILLFHLYKINLNQFSAVKNSFFLILFAEENPSQTNEKVKKPEAEKAQKVLKIVFRVV